MKANGKEDITMWRVLAGFLIGIAFTGLLMMCSSCTTTEYVAVPQQHTEHHWHTDSIHTTDSVICEKTTTIMQLDSAAMAAYGIQLKSAERAWLVKTAELERQIQQLMQLSATRDTVRDSIPYPVEVTKEVAAELSWWQQTKIHIGGAVLWLLLIVAVVWIGKKHIKKLTS